MKGVVVKSTGSWYLVRDLDGGQLYDCRIKGKFRVAGIKSTNPLAVGDLVSFEPEENDEGQGIIDGIEDRKNYIIRKSVNLSKRVHIIAANMDQALLVTTLANRRPLRGSWTDSFPPQKPTTFRPLSSSTNVICTIVKTIRSELEYRKAVYSAIGYHLLETSATEGLGLEELATLLKGKTTLLSGHSGVGKSTLNQCN
jgi:ribosome biogenesis GTPase